MAVNLADVSVAGPGFGLSSRRVSCRDMAGALRGLARYGAAEINVGQAGMSTSMTDVATVLYSRYLKFDPDHHDDWPDRDRLILSAGHGSTLLRALLHLAGGAEYTGLDIGERNRIRPSVSGALVRTELGHTPGVETIAGPFGQGLANAVGMALAERMLAARYGSEWVDHYTYVIVGDGCLMEGLSHEAISLAGHLRLHKLIVLFDDNQDPIGGAIDPPSSDDVLERFVAAGWSVKQIDGHDYAQIDQAIDGARSCHRPSLIACRTRQADGAPARSGFVDVDDALREIPDLIRRAWRSTAERGRKAYAAWTERLDAGSPESKQRFLNDVRGDLSQELNHAVLDAKRSVTTLPQGAQVSSQQALETFAAVQANLIGGAANPRELSNVKATDMKPVRTDDFGGRYVHYGLREHAMAAAMNGIALHGGFIACGGMPLAASDYCRPALRLSALMCQRVIYLMTEDAIGPGGDAPTHSAIEHLAALRSIPNLQVIRPADAVETVEAWELALRSRRRPTVLCLSRQSLPPLRTSFSDINLSARGGYVLRHARQPRRITLIASGSEVAIALEAARRLHLENVEVAVVSMPCVELFAEQSEDYRQRVLGDDPRIVIEAGVRHGWDRWIGPQGDFIGIDGVGPGVSTMAANQPSGISVERVLSSIRRQLAAIETHVGRSRVSGS